MLTKQLKVLLDTSLSAGRTYEDVRGMLKMQGFIDSDINLVFEEYRGSGAAQSAAPQTANPAPAAAPSVPQSPQPPQPPNPFSSTPFTPPIVSPPPAAPQTPVAQPADVPEVTQSEVLRSEVPAGFMPDIIPPEQVAPPTYATPSPIQPGDPRTYMPPADSGIEVVSKPKPTADDMSAFTSPFAAHTTPAQTSTYVPPVATAAPVTSPASMTQEQVPHTSGAGIQVGLGGIPELQHAVSKQHERQQHSSVAIYITVLLLLLMCVGAFFFWYLVIRDAEEPINMLIQTEEATTSSEPDIFAPMDPPAVDSVRDRQDDVFSPPSSDIEEASNRGIPADSFSDNTVRDPIYDDYNSASNNQPVSDTDTQGADAPTPSNNIDPYTGQPFLTN